MKLVYPLKLFIFRLIFAIFSVATMLYVFLTSTTLEYLKYYTIQTNLLVSAWLVLSIIFSTNENRFKAIKGKLRGAVNLYITVTFLVFAVILAPMMPAGSLFNYVNITTHYIIPVLFIIDWTITEMDIRYNWGHLGYWVLYPIGYLIFAVIHGILTTNYLYPFLELDDLALLVFIISVLGVTALFLILGSIYIGINRKFYEMKHANFVNEEKENGD